MKNILPSCILLLIQIVLCYQDYGKFSFNGMRGNRQQTVSFLGLNDERSGEWSVAEKELKTL